MRTFLVRMISMAVILTSLVSYQAVGAVRVRDEKIAELTASLRAKEEELAEITSDAAEIAAMLDEADAEKSGGAAPPDEKEESPNAYADGTYHGEAMGYGGIVAVTVTVEGGAVTDITVDSHEGEDAAYYAIASGVVQTILSAQSTDVDTVTGATLSSGAILAAVGQCLEEAAP